MYPEQFEKNPKQALQYFISRRMLSLLESIESAIENQNCELANSIYTVSEVALKMIYYTEDVKVIFSDIQPLMK